MTAARPKLPLECRHADEGERIKQLHLVLVCHAELGLDGTWGVYDEVQPQVDRMVARVADATGKAPRITYCLTNEFITDKLDEAVRLHEAGHEIGVHSHMPGAHRKQHAYDGRYALRLDPHGVLNQDRVAAALRSLLIALGFPPPGTHVSGMFSLQKTTLRLLADAGFRADCSLIPNGRMIRHEALKDFVIADNRRRTDLHPYRPSLEDPWQQGDAPLVELPVCGNLGEAYFAIDWARNLDDELTQIKRRINQLDGVDVYQSYWHHFEFSRSLDWTRGDLHRATDFLIQCAAFDEVRFSTAQEAAAAFERA